MQPLNNKGIEISIKLTPRFSLRGRQQLKYVTLIKSRMPNGYRNFKDEIGNIIEGNHLYLYTEKTIVFLFFVISIKVQKFNT